MKKISNKILWGMLIAFATLEFAFFIFIRILIG
jgi:hypothetical protein